MPPPQDRYEVNLELVTVAGTEFPMQANLAHYEDVAELEDDILCFLPTVSDLEVFGCELELLDLCEQQPLSEAFRTVLLQRPQLQVVVRPCMVEGAFHLAFPDRRQRRLPQSSACPGQPERGNCRQSFLRGTFNPTRRSGNWHPTYRNCGLAELPAITDCQASNFGRQSGGRDFHGVLCAASGRCTRVCPLWTKGVC